MLLSLFVTTVLAATPLESLLHDAVTQANADVTGDGSSVEITYSSEVSFTVLTLLLEEDGTFDPLAYLRSEFDAGQNVTASINLTKSLSWSPGDRTYRLYFLSTTTQTPQFHDIEFIEPTLAGSVSSFILHLASPLPYSPSIYHRVDPYKGLGMVLTPLFGVLLIVLFLWKRNMKLILVLCLLVSARFSLDALRYTFDHSRTWLTSRTYAAAGALPEIGKDLKDLGAEGVFLCHTGTSYARRALGYHAYPILIVGESPTHVVVHNAVDWSLGDGILRCGDETFNVLSINQYIDGSQLFSVIQQ